MALIGNSETFTGEFYADDNITLTDPTDGSVYFITYDRLKNENNQIDKIPIALSEKVSTGIYKIQYVIPPPAQPMIYEFVGTIAGNPSLNNQIIQRTYT